MKPSMKVAFLLLTFSLIILLLYCFNDGITLQIYVTNTTSSSKTTTTGTHILTINNFSASLPLPEKEWDYLIYLGGDNNLCGFAEKDLEEMTSVYSSYALLCNIVILFDTDSVYCSNLFPAGKAYLLYITSTNTLSRIEVPGLIPLDGTEINMGDPATVKTFLNFAKQKFPAKYYHLTMWDHGDGWRKSPIPQGNNYDTWKSACYDNSSSDKLTTKELQQALNDAGFSGTTALDVLTFDECLMGMTEVVHQYRNNAKYVGASSREIQYYGFDYDKLLSTFFSYDSTNRTAEKFAITTGETFVSQGGCNTFCVADTSLIHNLATAVNSWVLTLGIDVTTRRAELVSAKSSLSSYNNYVPYYDLYNISLKTSISNSIESTSMRNIIDDMILYYSLCPSNVNQRALSIVCGDDPSVYYANTEYNSTNIDWASSSESPDYAEIIRTW